MKGSGPWVSEWVSFAAVKLIPSRCLATVADYRYGDTDWWEEFMKYVIETSSGVILHLSNFMRIGSGIKNVQEGGYTDTHTAKWSHKITFYFLNKESRLKAS
jgi:hypothetical protein